MTSRHFNVLFVCTGNSGRSILGEAILNAVGGDRFRAFSAGSHPTGTVHPLTQQTLLRLGIPTDGLRSKGWDEFTQPQAPRMDFIFTVCDRAAGESCPVWPGQPITAHWGMPDPAAAAGTPEAQAQAFHDAAITLRRRIDLMLALPLERLDALSLQNQIRDIGER
jgi:arsenate reductase